MYILFGTIDPGTPGTHRVRTIPPKFRGTVFDTVSEKKEEAFKDWEICGRGPYDFSERLDGLLAKVSPFKHARVVFEVVDLDFDKKFLVVFPVGVMGIHGADEHDFNKSEIASLGLTKNMHSHSWLCYKKKQRVKFLSKRAHATFKEEVLHQARMQAKAYCAELKNELSRLEGDLANPAWYANEPEGWGGGGRFVFMGGPTRYYAKISGLERVEVSQEAYQNRNVPKEQIEILFAQKRKETENVIKKNSDDEVVARVEVFLTELASVHTKQAFVRPEDEYDDIEKFFSGAQIVREKI